MWRTCGAIGVVALLLGAPAGATQAAAQQASPSPGAVRGIVYDSLTHQVLRGATVQILSATDDSDSAFSRFATTDELGAYRLDSIPSGEYMVGFFHPALDSLGLDLTPRAVLVQQGNTARIDLGIPSHKGAIEMLCGKAGATDTSALIVGFVRDATTARPANAKVLLQWRELVIGRGTIQQEGQQLETSTRSDGWYALCNVPVNALMELRAVSQSDTTGAIAANLVAQHLSRRDLYVGPTTRVPRPASDSAFINRLTDTPSEMWSGPARLTGEVHDPNGRPVPHARVSVVGGATEAMTNENGEFTLVDLPSGSQTLNVRALGFVPERETVHLLLGDSQNSAALTLTTLKAMLDTIRVTASRVFDADVNGFQARKRAGIGRFVDRAAIDRRQPTNPSDVLHMIPGVEVLSAGVGFFGKVVAMRSPFGGGMCHPDLYVDGVYFRSGTAELDDLVLPDEIEGIEIYTRQSQAPMQFANRMSGCGSIVVWRQERLHGKRKKPK